MTADSTAQPLRLSGANRTALLALVVGLAAPLAVARVLEPDPRGHGTHQQLGLPPCTFVVLFGMRCPTCGGTTSWAYLVRGRLVEAVRANAGGALLGVLAMVSLPWLAISAARGRWLGWTPNGTAIAWLAVALFAVMLIDWGMRLFAG